MRHVHADQVNVLVFGCISKQNGLIVFFYEKGGKQGVKG